uniref:AlNc14C383G11240 protein n=1 Tax=Albugo laibachii Nc14 TaxID=890382 RepID=F0WYH9_9STRA|nr:AlNc14C383G11240 [Albugo laibachii Nc14]|eukprot:CCA26534.1 AlNc14C383G11240 [Albugo laibachii Nc14]
MQDARHTGQYLNQDGHLSRKIIRILGLSIAIVSLKKKNEDEDELYNEIPARLPKGWCWSASVVSDQKRLRVGYKIAETANYMDRYKLTYLTKLKNWQALNESRKEVEVVEFADEDQDCASQVAEYVSNQRRLNAVMKT